MEGISELKSNAKFDVVKSKVSLDPVDEEKAGIKN